MSIYERALAAAGEAPLTVPEFDAIAEAAAHDREAWAREGAGAAAGARRWLIVAALAWLLLPLDAIVLVGGLNSLWANAGALALDIAVGVLPPALILVWGARLARDHRFHAAILVRAIAASNLVIALLYAVSVGGYVGTAFSIVLAVASGRSLQLLGDRGLDGGDDPSSSFAPVRFRGLLIVALIMAFADALTLLFSSSLQAVKVLAFAVSGFQQAGQDVTLLVTLAATLVMAGNVWGLLRLRTWALFSNMISNLAIAGLALGQMLATNSQVSIALAVTAVIQLLVPVPILAAALGDDQAGRSHERLGGLLRWVVPVVITATVVMAALNFGPGLPNAWLGPWLPNAWLP